MRTAIASVFAVRVNPPPSIATPPRPAAAIRRSRSVRIGSPPFGVPGMAAQMPPGLLLPALRLLAFQMLIHGTDCILGWHWEIGLSVEVYSTV